VDALRATRYRVEPAPQAEALETTLDFDIFCPPRQDWLDGSDAYLRRT
jgi:hypothetical protein